MKIFDKMLGGNTLYYPGCLTKFVANDLERNYEKLLKDAGVDYIKLGELELCCGSPALKAGYDRDFEDIARKNLKVFKDHSVNKIITNCPACFMVLKKYYKEVLQDDWDIEVAHISQVLSEKIKKGGYKPKAGGTGKITFHDPCHLGRQMGVYEEPREIIKALGYDIEEMELNRQESYCCGGGGGVKSNEPELANRIAQDRANQAKATGADCLATCCPLCYLNLKENSKEIKVVELSELFNAKKND